MKINLTQELEIAKRLGITKPNCPPDVAAFLADKEEFANGLDRYENSRFSSWRADTEEVRATIAHARQSLDTIEALADKVDSHSDTVALATITYQEQLRTYWNAIETEENRPRRAFDKAREEFVALISKEKRSLNRKINKAEWNSEELPELRERLWLVDTMLDEANYLNYNADTAPAFTELVLWEEIAKGETRANQFLEFVSETKTLAN